jgi:hypothetical protein
MPSFTQRSDAAKKNSTLSHKAGIRHGGHTKIKNNDPFNLSLCPYGFLVFAERRIPANRRVIFVFEDFLPK